MLRQGKHHSVFGHVAQSCAGVSIGAQVLSVHVICWSQIPQPTLAIHRLCCARRAGVRGAEHGAAGRGAWRSRSRDAGHQLHAAHGGGDDRHAPRGRPGAGRPAGASPQVRGVCFCRQHCVSLFFACVIRWARPATPSDEQPAASPVLRRSDDAVGFASLPADVQMQNTKYTSQPLGLICPAVRSGSGRRS